MFVIRIPSQADEALCNAVTQAIQIGLRENLHMVATIKPRYVANSTTEHAVFLAPGFDSDENECQAMDFFAGMFPSARITR